MGSVAPMEGRPSMALPQRWQTSVEELAMQRGDFVLLERELASWAAQQGLVRIRAHHGLISRCYVLKLGPFRV